MRQKASFKKKGSVSFGVLDFQSNFGLECKKIEFLFKVTGKYNGRQNCEQLYFSSNKNKMNKN